ncbi:MAG: hypothetical protein C4332_01115 [Meiothermus sp.]
MTAFVIALLLSLGFAQNWQTAKSPGFVVRTASSPDRALLPQVFEILRKARRDLSLAGLNLPQTVTVVIHPNLKSYTDATKVPWFVIAVSDRTKNRIVTQRLRILVERGSLERTLRHELFHLVQPEGWPRWKAEGSAMRFAGDKPTAEPIPGISEDELNKVLADPPDARVLARAVATAYALVGKTSRP